ncbi:MAG: hypothetical protein ACOX69_02910 [Coriobacteriales bacterium]
MVGGSFEDDIFVEDDIIVGGSFGGGSIVSKHGAIHPGKAEQVWFPLPDYGLATARFSFASLEYWV